MRMPGVPRAKQPINPFYVLTAVAGVIFTITACGYGLLMLRANRAAMATGSESLAADGAHPLLSVLDQHGILILAVEVGILAVASVAAIALDHYRGKRIASQSENANREQIVS